MAGKNWRVGLIRLALGAGFVCASWVVLGAEQAHAADAGTPHGRGAGVVARAVGTVEHAKPLASASTRTHATLTHATKRFQPVVRPIENAVTRPQVVRTATTLVTRVPLVSRPVRALRSTVAQVTSRVDQAGSRVEPVLAAGIRLVGSPASASSSRAVLTVPASPSGARARVHPGPSRSGGGALVRPATVVPILSAGPAMGAGQLRPNAPPSPASPFDLTPSLGGGMSGLRSGATDFAIYERWSPMAPPSLTDPSGFAVSRVVAPAAPPVHRPD